MKKKHSVDYYFSKLLFLFDFSIRTFSIRIREVYSLFENDNDIKKEIEDEIGDLVAVDNAHDMIEAELKVMLTNVEYEVTNSLRSIKLFIEQSGQPFHQSYQQHCLQSTIKRFEKSVHHLVQLYDKFGLILFIYFQLG